MRTNIVITMAGKGSRFKEVGYAMPKYEINAHDICLFDWSIKSLSNFLVEKYTLIFICLKSNQSESFLTKRCNELGISNFHIIELDEISDGQATSAYNAQTIWNPNDPLLIYNIDTYVNPSYLDPKFIKEGSEGWIPCFHAKGNHWSFVDINKKGWAKTVKEKEKISNNASVGLWFKSASLYEEIYSEFFLNEKNLVNGEKYIAQCINI